MSVTCTVTVEDSPDWSVVDTVKLTSPMSVISPDVPRPRKVS